MKNVASPSAFMPIDPPPASSLKDPSPLKPISHRGRRSIRKNLKPVKDPTPKVESPQPASSESTAIYYECRDNDPVAPISSTSRGPPSTRSSTQARQPYVSAHLARLRAFAQFQVDGNRLISRLHSNEETLGNLATNISEVIHRTYLVQAQLMEAVEGTRALVDVLDCTMREHPEFTSQAPAYSSKG